MTLTGFVIPLSAYLNTIDHCSVTGEMNGVSFSSGGILGQLSQGTLTNRDAHVRLDVDSRKCRWDCLNLGRWETSLATGDVSNANSSGNAGGLVGFNQVGSMMNSFRPAM
jgi:hypothetical protein